MNYNFIFFYNFLRKIYLRLVNPNTERYKEMSDRHQRAVIATEEKGKIQLILIRQ